jgi:hypothetical protein
MNGHIPIVGLQIEDTSKIVIHLIAYLHLDGSLRQCGHDSIRRRRHYLVSPVIRFIEYAGVIAVVDIVYRDDRGGGCYGTEEEAQGMPGRTIYIWLVGMIIIVMIGVIPASVPEMRRPRIGRPVGFPARGTMATRRAIVPGGTAITRRSAIAGFMSIAGRASVTGIVSITRGAAIAGVVSVAGRSAAGGTAIPRRACHRWPAG